VRESKLFIEGSLAIPKRYVTRPPRLNDDTTETISIEKNDFMEKEKSGFFSLYWKRYMEFSREEWYGFSTYNEKIPLFSANNALLYSERKVEIFPKNLMNNMLIIGICANPYIIKERLKIRSPDLFKNKHDEINYRLSDSPDNIKKYSHVIVTNNLDPLSLRQQSISFFNELTI
jgi:ribose 1,5-bisphosphokinase PhnN